MSDFELSVPQSQVLDLVVRLIGISGVRKRPEHGDSIVLDLLPASHVVFGSEPFCVRVNPAGHIEFISDEEAGLDERPDMVTAMRQDAEAMSERAADWVRRIEALDDPPGPEMSG